MLRQAAEFVDTAATPTAAECVAEEDDDSGICSASNSKRYESDCGQFISHTRRHPGWEVLIRMRLHGEHIPDHGTARPQNCQTTELPDHRTARPREWRQKSVLHRIIFVSVWSLLVGGGLVKTCIIKHYPQVVGWPAAPRYLRQYNWSCLEQSYCACYDNES